jgi:phosphate transport system ATP-binding protein
VFYGNTQSFKEYQFDILRTRSQSSWPSGCGKTTSLEHESFSELSEDTRLSGQVLLDGFNIYDPAIDVTEIRKKTGLLAQRPFTLPMSIFDNVAYGMRIHKVKRTGAPQSCATLS